MAKRRTSLIEDIIDIISNFPWWVGCLLAIISFLVLHVVASIKVQMPLGYGNLGSYAGKQLYVTLAMVGQYMLPAAFSFGSLISLIKRFQQKNRYEKVKSKPTPNALFEISWQEFEGLVAEFFRRRGYAVNQTGGNGPDGGIDIVLTKGNDKYLVQCKQWKAYKVGVQVVRELHGVMAAEGAAGGFVVTAGEFSADAKEFARGLNIYLFNGARLHQMIREVRQISSNSAAQAVSQKELAIPSCPICGQPMVVRKAKKGTKAGKQFWGCSKFPKCKGTLPFK